MKKLSAVFRESSCYKPFLLSILATGLAYGLYKGVLDNYLAEVVRMGEFDRGVVEFFRELPGLFLVFLLAVLYTFSAEKMYKLGSIIMLLGMCLISAVPPVKFLVTAAICIHSVGDHIQLGMKSTMCLEYAREGRGGEALGHHSAIGQIGTLVGFVAVAVTFVFVQNTALYRLFFVLAAGFTAVSLFWSLRLKDSSETDKAKSRFYFRKKFKKYYMLEIFYGSRKQVFMTFGPYVLILFYGASTTVISALFAVTAITGYFLAPVVGRIIDRIGYKAVMVADTLILVIVCFFYGFAHHIFPRNVAFIVCCVNYVLDSIISMASMASNVYVQDISDSPEEFRATISTGISVNHLISILIALFGGWIWQAIGIETLFMISAFLGLCNSAYAATIKPSESKKRLKTN